MPRYLSISHITWNDFMLTCRPFFGNGETILRISKCIFNQVNKNIYLAIKSDDIASIDINISNCMFNSTFFTSVNTKARGIDSPQSEIPLVNYTIRYNKFIGKHVDAIVFINVICRKSSSILISNNEISNSLIAIFNASIYTPLVVSNNIFSDIDTCLLHGLVNNPVTIFENNVFTNVKSLCCSTEDNVKLSRNNIFNNCGDWMMNYFHE